ncbi:hypothetical protein E2562_005093 [Oryza meyeriana var. granulata]|uniref:Uncharacterized protein n=1 Tax=Oryza meyeriana var. granulata TaxID=110450 RepID=A0A6G1BTH6_9ORYZ|nr:hypothetical protein E2562_005093 [Oryza meyeriana var. granulata]
MAPLFHMEALLPSSISPKINTVLHSHIYPQVGHVFRALAKFKSLILDVLSKKRAPTRGGSGGGKKYAIGYRSRPEKRKKRIVSKITGFMKLRFTWRAAASVTPARAKDLELHCHPYYYDDSTWNVVVPADAAEEMRGGDDGEDCGYMCWLEEERSVDAVPAAEEEDGGDGDSNGAMNEIDRLAERFIARCHAKFLLEKQESYRRYQEMMARSM